MTHKIQKALCLVSAFSLITVLFSCEEVVDLKLQRIEPRIVIEGGISNANDFHTIRISKTLSVYDSTQFTGVNGAKVAVVSGTGQQIVFSESSAGVYRSGRFRGIPGTTYTLNVEVEGKSYSAKSTMPQPVRPDSINFKRLTFFGDERVYPAVNFTDPAGIQNNYRYIVKVNNKIEADRVTEDRFFDGNPTSDMISFDGDGVLPGDKVDVEVQCIDRNVFKFYFAVLQAGGIGGPPVAPANPETNLSNGAVGIFSAYTRTLFSITRR